MRLLHPSSTELAPDDLFDLYDVPGPHLRAGFVASLDGTISVEGRSEGLSSPADKAVFRALRTVCDAVVVGAGTAREENYGSVKHSEAALAWRASHDRDATTPVVVVSRSGRIHERLREGPLIACVPAGVQVAEGIDVISSVEPAEIMAALHSRGLTRLLCEGGPGLFTSFLAAGVVDELCLTMSPALVGRGPQLLGEVPVSALELVSLVHDAPGVLLGRWRVVRSSDD